MTTTQGLHGTRNSKALLGWEVVRKSRIRSNNQNDLSILVTQIEVCFEVYLLVITLNSLVI
jgi:hypothetical protein